MKNEKVRRFNRNGVKEAIQSSGFALGTFIQHGSPENAEIAALSGFDFVVLDMEHGSFGIDMLVNMIRGVQLAGSTPLVRLPDDSEAGIKRTLDAGSMGILIPNVSSGEQAEKIAKAARYAPLGTRGACPRVRATRYGVTSWEEHVDWCEKNVMVWLLIENVEGFANLKDIVATPGIDAITLGAFDLSQSMGLRGKTNHPEVVKTIESAVALAKKNNVDIVLPLFETSPVEIKKSVRKWANLGVRIFNCMTDRRILQMGFKDTFSSLATIRENLK